MPKKEAIEVYTPEWLVIAEEILPTISYPEAEQFFHTVCELKGIKNVTIKENLRRKGAICFHPSWCNFHRIEIGKISSLTEIVILHEIAHTLCPEAKHNYLFIKNFENLMKEFLPNKVIERWHYYRSKISKMRTKNEICKFYWNRLDEMKKST